MPWSFIVWIACSEPVSPAPEPPAPRADVAPAPAAPDAPVAPLMRTRPQCTLVATCAADCDAGDGLACAQLGLWHQYGLAGAERDVAKAADLQKRACDAGVGIGCYNLAAQRKFGMGVAKDPALANALLRRAYERFDADCSAGGIGWCVNQGLMLHTGQGVTADKQRAVAILRKACAANEAQACIALSSGALRSDLGAARSLLQEACGKGQMVACGPLGETYLDANPPEPANASVFFKMGCDGEDPRACRNLGYQLLTGDGAVPDEPRGLELLTFACTSPSAPDATACTLAGLSLLSGAKGIMPDEARAAELLATACFMGQAPACTASAQLSSQGRGPYKRSVDRLRFLDLACALGADAACAELRGG